MTKAKILVVEDESITARDLELTLLELGYDVVAKVPTGEEAILQAEATKPDLVLMDIILAGEMNGIEAAQQINERFDIPVVYLTAHADEGTLSRAKITGPYGYIVKPFNEVNLHSNIEMALYKGSMERRLKESYRLQKKGLYGIIHIVSELIKAHDSFLFMHQEKVTHLARAIAKQMALTPSQIEAVELGAWIHGLGLLNVSADILAWQGRQADTRLLLYREYPRIGYNLLKNIEFPWPIAQIILQHRELLDGSGFPSGLKGDDIILEARIVGLAYAVVKMIANPYKNSRSTMTVDDMLAKINAGRGTLYDAKAVDACVKLFEKDGYQLT